ncbi:MAG: hypothetical protein ACREV0_09150 [Burkholderiales bacterium]
MKRLRTDQQILRAIYDRYYDDFVSFERKPKTRGTKNFVPIDIPAVAQALKIESELVFDRLYYHLAPKYSRTDGQTRVPFFEKTFPNSVTERPDLHVVNFPLLESVLAQLEYEERKFRLPFTVSAFSLGVAILAFAANILLNWPGRVLSVVPAAAPATTPATNTPASGQK